MTKLNYIAFLSLNIALAACGDDLAPSEFTTGTGSTGDSTSPTESVPTTSASSGDSSGTGSQCEPEYPLPVQVFELAESEPTPEFVMVSRDCDVLDLVGSTEGNQLFVNLTNSALPARR